MTPAVFIALMAAAALADHPRTFLASIDGVRLGSGESIDRFEIDTWGVEFQAVCHIPLDWEITAGGFGPGGKVAGAAGHGASQLRAQDLKRLRAVVLIRMVGPVQKQQMGSVPATFSGFANIQSGWDDSSRKARLTFANIRLTPAEGCPPIRERY